MANKYLTGTKVCHLTSAHEPFDDRIFHKECKSLAEAGYDVAVIAQHDRDEVVDGINVIALKKSKNRVDRMFGLTIQIFFRALKQKSDIYHFHDPELLPVGVLLKLFSRKKIVYDVHEDYGKQILSKPYLPKWSRRGISVMINLIEYSSTGFFDGIVTATDDILNKFRNHNTALSVKNYPVISYFKYERNNGKENSIHGKVFNLVYIGNISKERGLNETIQALAYIDTPLKLSFYGNCDPTDSEFNLNNLKGSEKVQFVGWMEHKEVVAKLSNYDAGIVCLHPLPNYITALPIKLFEYMAAGLPVIASNFPILREIVEGNKCGICVDPLNPEEIAKAIRYLIAFPEKRMKMGQNGKQAILEKYNWEKENDKLINLYNNLLVK